MLNQVVLVGKITMFLEEKEKKIVVLKTDGEFPTTTNVQVSDSIFDSVKKHCEIGALVGVKGHLTYDFVDLGVECEKITFISGKNNGC